MVLDRISSSRLRRVMAQMRSGCVSTVKGGWESERRVQLRCVMSMAHYKLLAAAGPHRELAGLCYGMAPTLSCNHRIALLRVSCLYCYRDQRLFSWDQAHLRG